MREWESRWEVDRIEGRERLPQLYVCTTRCSAAVPLHSDHYKIRRVINSCELFLSGSARRLGIRL